MNFLYADGHGTSLYWSCGSPDFQPQLVKSSQPLRNLPAGRRLQSQPLLVLLPFLYLRVEIADAQEVDSEAFRECFGVFRNSSRIY